MRHFFRINVRDEGYVLHAGPTDGPFVAQPLGLESQEVPRAFLEAQRRVDESIRAGNQGWSLAVRYPDADHRLVLAYGCRIDAPDEFGRPGLSFVHGVELSQPKFARACLIGVLSAIGGRAGEHLYGDIEGMAAGSPKVNVQDFMVRLATVLDGASRLKGGSPHEGDLFAAVAHDCGGAAATAWLAMINQQMGLNHPWTVYDSVGENGVVFTRAHPPSGKVTATSQLLLHASFVKPQSVSAQRPGIPRAAVAAMIGLALTSGLAAWQTIRVSRFKAVADTLQQHKTAEDQPANETSPSGKPPPPPIPRAADHPVWKGLPDQRAVGTR